MTKVPPTPDREPRRRLPVLLLLLIFGLPLAVLVAGGFMVKAASHQGFTPIAGTPIAPKGH